MSKQPDMAVILPNSIRSTLPFSLGGARRIYGYRRDLRGLMLSGGPKPVLIGGKITPLPTRDYYLEICKWLGLTLPAAREPRLFIGHDLQKQGDDLLKSRSYRPL